MLILNQSPNLQDSLEKIGFINNDQSTTDFVNRMRNNATKKGMVFRGGEGVVLGMNRFSPELLDFRKLPDDVKNVSDVIGNLIKTPAGKRLAKVFLIFNNSLFKETAVSCSSTGKSCFFIWPFKNANTLSK